MTHCPHGRSAAFATWQHLSWNPHTSFLPGLLAVLASRGWRTRTAESCRLSAPSDQWRWPRGEKSQARGHCSPLDGVKMKLVKWIKGQPVCPTSLLGIPAFLFHFQTEVLHCPFAGEDAGPCKRPWCPQGKRLSGCQIPWPGWCTKSKKAVTSIALNVSPRKLGGTWGKF